MVEQSLSVREIIGLAADIMTLFGVSGVFAWSFVRKNIESGNTADTGVAIFAYSVKTFVALVLMLLLCIPAFFSHFFIILLTSSNYVEGDGLWNSQKSFAYVLAYGVTALWLIPLVVLTVSSVYVWSLEPFKRFSKALRG
ncbi:hypothetical protein P245_24975 [Comamonas thiooxydans]|uniref:Uncharacterized protein n=1 Tax=Comamonas thiooxydans TaxID=363952 RepID=A0A0E3B9R1_9BURK|nr:hypothetical protein [Comamonas thiooxydans]KGG83721.1 hypothetical protein P245_24975 [Comamonas thiooxydans]